MICISKLIINLAFQLNYLNSTLQKGCSFLRPYMKGDLVLKGPHSYVCQS